MLAYISIFHFLNDALKPELAVFQDPNQFRFLWQEYVAGRQKQHGFLNPESAFDAMQISLPDEVRQEWRKLEGISMQLQMKIPITFFIQKFPQKHKTRFFLCLFWQILEAANQILQYAMRTYHLNSKIQYEVMTFMVYLEQWMDDNQRLLAYSSKNKLRAYYQQLLAFNWLRTHETASSYIHPASLRYFKEELEEVMVGNGDLSELFTFSNPDKPPKENEIAEANASDGNIYAMIDEMTKDIQQLHQVTKQKADDLHMHEDRFLKPKEVCQMLGICSQTLGNWRRAGKFKNVKNIGNRFEYAESEIRDMMSQQ